MKTKTILSNTSKFSSIVHTLISKRIVEIDLEQKCGNEIDLILIKS